MKQFEIKITKSTRYVDFENDNEKVGNIGENLQTMLVFSFTDEFVDGQARLEYTINGDSQYVFMEKVGETYQTPVTSQLAQCGSIDLQLVITEGTDENEIPKFKSNVFYLPFGKSINAEVEQPEEYEEWIDIANTKLNEVDNLNIDMRDSVVTITRKDGTQYSENVKGEDYTITEKDYEEIAKLVDVGTELDINLENGEGAKSLQQTLDTTSWITTNQIVMNFIDEDVETSDGAKIQHLGDEIFVGTYGKSSFMQNGKGQTVGNKSHVEGSKCIAFENNSHSEGNETFAGGKHSHSEGNTTSAIGNSAHSEGLLSVAVGDNSHSEGSYTIAEGVSSHSEGHKTEAIEEYSHAEGFYAKAIGKFSHAQGHYTEAKGYYSHSEGNDTHAIGGASHSAGQGTYADGNHSTVIGKYNVRDINQNGVARHNLLFIIGNGNSDTERSNAHTVDKEGNGVYAGDLTIRGDKLVATEEYVDNLIGDIESILNEVV